MSTLHEQAHTCGQIGQDPAAGYRGRRGSLNEEQKVPGSFYPVVKMNLEPFCALNAFSHPNALTAYSRAWPNHPATPTATPDAMPTPADVSIEELSDALARLEETLAAVRRDAGNDVAAHDRELDAHLRALRALLDGDLARLAEDVIEAAKRALESAAPEAPLMMLTIAHDRLRRAVLRHARASMPRAA